MAGFKVQRPYTMPKEEVREAAEGLARNLERRHGVRARWDGDSVRIRGVGVNGHMTFDNDLIDISVTLSLLASAFQDVLKQEVNRYLDERIY
jgi:putative polyhydroxyalkanoate system protein